MRKRLSIYSSLILLFGLLAGVSHWTSFLVSDNALQAVIAAREIDKVQTIGRVIEELIVQESQRARLTARLTAARNSVGRNLAERKAGGSETLVDVLDDAIGASQVAVLGVVDSRGVAAGYRTVDPLRHGDLLQSRGVFEALSGDSQMSSSLESGDLTLFAIEPVRWQGKVVGAIIAGVHVDSALLRKIGEDVGSTLFLVSKTGQLLAASSEKQAYAMDVKAVDEALGQKVPIYRNDRVSYQTLAYVPVTIIDDAFVLIAAIDSSEAYALLARAKGNSAMYTVAILAVSILLGILLLRWVLSPLQALRRRAQSLAVEITGSRISADSRNEVQAVVEVLETLTDRLVRRNVELSEAKQAAEAANAAKSQFLSSMSHEIRTPLNGMLGMAEVLERTPLTPDQERYLRAITSAGQSLHGLLGDILDLAKIESGKIVLEDVDFDLRALLTQITDTFRELASARGDCLVADFALPATLPVRGDPTRLRQVLSNLLGNAIKFTERGCITLSAARLAPRTGETRQWWRLSVRDTGIGIDQAAIGRLFQPFVQADQSTTRRFGGSGLGLVICKHLAELMGGTIAAQSTVGVGSTFTVELPLADASSPLVGEAAACPTRYELHGRVLVAEDNPVNQAVIEAMLGQLGVTPTIVDNGHLAVDALSRAPFDLLLMDCQMPVMDGYLATASIRALPPPVSRIPIIALTANALPEDRQRCLDAGMNDYLSKPIRLDVLAACLSRWLPRSVAGSLETRPLPPPVDALPVARTIAPASSVLDRGALFDNPDFAGVSDGRLVRQVVERYLADSPKLIAAISAGVQNDDWPQLVRSAHSLKSSSATVGLPTLAVIAARIEALARREDGFGIAGELPALQDTFDEAGRELRLELEHLVR